MARRIEKLTAAQIAKFPEYVKAWTDIGLSTAPADRPRAEAAIARMYEIAGKRAPRIVWCGSPLSQGMTRAVVLQFPNVWASVRDSVRASVGASVRGVKSLGATYVPQVPGWEWSAGAWAALRPRPACSASPSISSRPTSSACT